MSLSVIFGPALRNAKRMVYDQGGEKSTFTVVVDLGKGMEAEGLLPIDKEDLGFLLSVRGEAVVRLITELVILATGAEWDEVHRGNHMTWSRKGT